MKKLDKQIKSMLLCVAELLIGMILAVPRAAAAYRLLSEDVNWLPTKIAS